MSFQALHRVVAVRVYFLPVRTRVPLKFGAETLDSVTCARVALRVVDRAGNEVEGWGETPLSVQWVWPAALAYAERHDALKEFCARLAKVWLEFQGRGHALEWGVQFQQRELQRAFFEFNEKRQAAAQMPWLAALVCCSPFDIALHDALGKLANRSLYDTYGAEFFGSDLGALLQPASDGDVSFHQRFPAEFVSSKAAAGLPAWHLVGGLDVLDESDLTGEEPSDGYPVTLVDWIRRDGLKCLKVKLRGTDQKWDLERLIRVGRIALDSKADWLSADFNCTVQDPQYVCDVLDRLHRDYPLINERLLYVEQPFPYELESHAIDVRSVARRKPLFLDESAHDWRMVCRGRELGWTGVALKTCKTQTGAILSACWAKAHGMQLMVQDLTNPMLAQIPHVLLAGHVGTIMGVETNAMQFYPAASEPEAGVHPGLYKRNNGEVNLSSISGPGFGYRLSEIARVLPDPEVDLCAE